MNLLISQKHKKIPRSIFVSFFWVLLAFAAISQSFAESTESKDTPPATPTFLPDGTGGIGFDSISYSSTLKKVRSPHLSYSL